MDSKKRKSQITIIIITILLIILCALIQQSYNTDETQVTDTYEYSNLNIDENKLNIFYLNVGMADSTFITMNGVNMLIDSGNDSDGYYITQFLKSQNINKIDYFIVTHFDEDHMGGAYKILEELEIGVLYMPNNSSNTKTYQKFLESIEDNNINTDSTLTASKDITYSLGNVNWKVLNINGNNLNDSSIVVELDYGITKYLFMGDASTNVENEVDWEEVDVLKVAHHGSDTSTSQEFLDKVNPKYAIISCRFK